MKNIFAKSLDVIIIFSVSAFFFAAISSFYLSKTAEIFLCIFVGALSFTGFVTVKSKKSLKNTNKKEVENVINQFVFQGSKFSYNFIKNAVKKKYEIKDKKTYFCVNNKAIFVRINGKKISGGEISEIYATAYNDNYTKILILSDKDCETDAVMLLNSLPPPKIQIIGADEIYKILKSLGSLPEIKIVLKEKRKIKLRDIAPLILREENTKRYFSLALVLVIFAAFLSYPIYYLIMAVTLFVLGLLSKTQIVDKIRKGNAKQK